MTIEARRVHSIDEALEHIPGPENAGHIIMREVPTEGYFKDNSQMIRQLIQQGYQGIYISFQRPFKNVIDLFVKEGIDVNKILFIDAAAALSGDQQECDEHCIPISEDINIDELVQAIYQSLPRLDSQKRFVFIDSLSTITLYKPLSETMRFSEFLVNTVRRENSNDLALIFNVSSDLTQKEFIRDVAFRVDNVVEAL